MNDPLSNMAESHQIINPKKKMISENIRFLQNSIQCSNKELSWRALEIIVND